MSVFIGLSYASFIVHLLHLQSFWDSYLPEMQFPCPPGSSLKVFKFEQDISFLVRPNLLYLFFTDQWKATHKIFRDPSSILASPTPL